ncbi:MAG: ribonuclease III [Lactobacillaceae bacterium]|jgi:ribonuclease-3|nr:ribonuclease III [Lactobacillaceae bacterium]
MFVQLQHELADKFAIHFNDLGLLEEALTQANYINEHPGYPGHDYQRLEFLGDAVMQQATAVYLFKKFPDWDEGPLTELRIMMVQTRSFAALTRDVGLDKYIQLGRGEEISGGRTRPSLLEDIWESFIGALFLDQGQDEVMRFLELTLFPKVDAGYFEKFFDYKTKLQEHLQRNGSVKISYTKLDEHLDAEHNQVFTVSVGLVGQKELGRGQGHSLKDAEKAAARVAYQKLLG